MTPPVVLTVAGTDSGGGAGVAADLATFAALGVHGACVVTAVTAQDTLGVRAVHQVPLDVVAAQLDAVLADLDPPVVKTGMLGSAAVVELVAGRCASRVLVVDPVLRATSGAVLGDASVVDAYVQHLLPVTGVLTPNLDEARALAAAAGLEPGADAPDLAAGLALLGPAVVLTGGDEADAGTCTDWVALPGERPRPLTHPGIATRNDHGTGCTFSAALAAGLAAPPDVPNPGGGLPPTPGRPASDRLWYVAAQASAFTAAQLQLSSTWDLGRGRGPVAHTIPTTEEMCR